MATHPKHAAASSRYRQLRLTVTSEVGGRFSWRLLAKGLNDTWREQHLIAQGSHVSALRIENTEDAIAAVVDLLRAEMLP